MCIIGKLHRNDLVICNHSREGNITVHHECSCRIMKSHPRGMNFYQGRGLLAYDGLFFSHF